jgi:hypothetical protein
MKTLFLLMLLLVPGLSQAAEYACKLATGWESVQAGSAEEAKHIASQRWSRNWGCVAGSPKDSFVTDGFFASNMELRPYLPMDIHFPEKPRQTMKKSPGAPTDRFACDSTGGFLPDNSNDTGWCRELDSASMGKWKLRGGGGATGSGTGAGPAKEYMLWRQINGGWQFWVRVELSGAAMKITPEARHYAESRGFTVHEAGIASTASSVVPQSIGGRTTAPADVVQGGIQKGANFLKGLSK